MGSADSCGGASSRVCTTERQFAVHVEQYSPRRKTDTLAASRDLEKELAELMKRVEQSQAMVRQRKTTAKSVRNLNTLNERQRALLQKSAKQLFMDGIDRLTTKQAGHVNLADIGCVGQSELLSTCEVLGGQGCSGQRRVTQYACRVSRPETSGALRSRKSPYQSTSFLIVRPLRFLLLSAAYQPTARVEERRLCTTMPFFMPLALTACQPLRGPRCVARLSPAAQKVDAVQAAVEGAGARDAEALAPLAPSALRLWTPRLPGSQPGQGRRLQARTRLGHRPGASAGAPPAYLERLPSDRPVLQQTADSCAPTTRELLPKHCSAEHRT